MDHENDITDRLRAIVRGTGGLDEAEEAAILSDALDEIERLRAQKEPDIICYWDTDDTEVGEPTIWEIIERHGHDVVVGVDHVAVVRTTYHATLPAADEAAIPAQ